MKTILVDIAHTFFTYDQGMFQKMYDLLEQYPNRKILVTNANDNKMKEKGMIDLPYEVFTLENNPNKTKKEYFKKLLEYYQLRPKDVVYFDHNPECISSAEELGIMGYYYDSDKEDLKGLKEFLDENLN